MVPWLFGGNKFSDDWGIGFVFLHGPLLGVVHRLPAHALWTIPFGFVVISFSRNKMVLVSGFLISPVKFQRLNSGRPSEPVSSARACCKSTSA